MLFTTSSAQVTTTTTAVGMFPTSYSGTVHAMHACMNLYESLPLIVTPSSTVTPSPTPVLMENVAAAVAIPVVLVLLLLVLVIGVVVGVVGVVLYRRHHPETNKSPLLR